MRKVVSFEKERQSRCFRQRVNEAVSVVQPSFVLAAFTVDRKRVDSDLHVAWAHAFHFNSRFLNEGMKLARCLRSMPVHHHNSRLDQSRG